MAEAIRTPSTLDLGHIAKHIEQVGYPDPENLLVALAVYMTVASPLEDIAPIALAAERIGNNDRLLEAAGVAFAFNTINRIADARRVQLEFRFLRELKSIRGWLDRRLVSLVGLAYDLSFTYQPRHSTAQMQDRVAILFERLGVTEVPSLFSWLSQSPAVLEGVVEMVEANVLNAKIRFDILKEAAAIAVASRATPQSDLRRAVDQALSQSSLPDTKTLLSLAAAGNKSSDSDLVSTCRRYAWHVANAAYKITDEHIHKLSALGLSDAEILDLTLTASVFSALAIIEPISVNTRL